MVVVVAAPLTNTITTTIGAEDHMTAEGNGTLRTTMAEAPAAGIAEETTTLMNTQRTD